MFRKEAYFDKDGRVHAELACARCRYQLRGLREMGHCPECGEPVSNALAALAIASDPAWVRPAGLGAMCLAAGYAFRILVAMLLFAGKPYLANFVFVLGIQLQALGFWGFTCREPRPVLAEATDMASIIARVAVTLAAIAILLGWLLGAWGWFAMLILVLFLAGEAAACFVTAILLRERLPRLDSDRVAQQAPWACGIVAGTVLLFVGLVFTEDLIRSRMPEMVRMSLIWVHAVGLIWLSILLLCFWRSLTKEAFVATIKAGWQKL